MEPKFQILKSDYIDFRHPTDKRQRIVRLYRIISLRELSIPGNYNVALNEIGGYVESEANLSHDGNCWIANSAKVFDRAQITDDSLVKDDAAVFEDAMVKGNSIISNYARVRGNPEILDGIISDCADVKGSPKIHYTAMRNSSAIYGKALVGHTNMHNGAMIHGDAVVEACTLLDVSEIRGSADVYNCKLSGRAIIQDGKHEHNGFNTEIELIVTTGKGELK